MIADRIELAIFDCDRVLVDSEPIINRAHADVLTACGGPIREHDLVERSRSPPIDYLLAGFGRGGRAGLSRKGALHQVEASAEAREVREAVIRGARVD